MSNDVREMVETSHPDTKSARNMPDAANSDASLQGYAAVNAASGETEIARRAYDLYLERQRECIEGCADDDWFRAENEVRRRRETNAG
jgi:hypothetical protein